MVSQICAVSCREDGLRFDIADLTIEEIRPDEEYAGKRARFRAWLGTARIAVQLDIGVGDALAMAPEDVTIPTMLFALPEPRLRAYPREQSVAEKFEAMVKLDTRNSRMKDFHDMWALAGAFAFDGASLRHAVAACFERRGTPLIGETPGVLSRSFYHEPELVRRWRSYVAGSAILVRPPDRFDVIGERILQFLDPVWVNVAKGSPLTDVWPPSGPWSRAVAPK